MTPKAYHALHREKISRFINASMICSTHAFNLIKDIATN